MNAKRSHPNRRISFLLRLWSETPADSTVNLWRCSLTHIQTGEKRGFASLDEAMRFLQKQMLGEHEAVITRSGSDQ